MRIVPFCTCLLLANAPAFSQSFDAEFEAISAEVTKDGAGLPELYRQARRAEALAGRAPPAEAEALLRLAATGYRRILAYDETAGPAYLRLGVIHERLGNTYLAREYYRRAAGFADIPADIRAEVEARLRRLDGDLARNRFSGRISLTLQHETDAPAEIGDGEQLLQKPEGVATSSAIATAGLTHVFDPGWQNAATLETSLDLSTSVHDGKARYLDSSYAGLRFGPRLRAAPFGLEARFRPYAVVSGLWSDDAPYSTDYGVGLEAELQQGPALSWRLHLSTVEQEHGHGRGDLDGRETRGRLSASWYPRQNVVLGAAISSRETDANGDLNDRSSSAGELWSFVSHGAPFGATARDWVTGIEYRRERSSWGTEPGSGPKRHDWRDTVTLSTSVPVARNVELELAVGWDRRESSDAKYDYENRTISAGLSRSF
ncbi:hypothetical protein [Poseidonocella sp. HB161398]|uniref:hypothetical protein n=1 Tax=Poseidonocella sp. HB161398 TaxID=2320855 RepID=UPI001107C8E8|nr:hypothetical protein [Poseidonocella sp. HB161398]